jgi:hypothetical protein
LFQSYISEWEYCVAAVSASFERSLAKGASMTLTDLTFLILNLNSLVDRDLHKGVSLEEAKQHIECGDVLGWLEEKYGVDMDLSIYRDRPSAKEITEGLRQILGGYSGRERRKWGVENNGICLLIAWVNELVQQRQWKERDRAA